MTTLRIIRLTGFIFSNWEIILKIWRLRRNETTLEELETFVGKMILEWFQQNL